VPTYDLHQHLWPERFIAALRARTAPPMLSQQELVTTEGRFPVDLALHEPHARILALDRDGIDIAVLSLQPSLAVDALGPTEAERSRGRRQRNRRRRRCSGGRFSPSRRLWRAISLASPSERPHS
jgi:hypothetical protein